MRFRMTFGNQIILAVISILVVSAATYKTVVDSFNGPKNWEILNFPLVEQPDQITCGPTSALMLLKYYGNDTVTLDEVKLQSGTHWFDYDGEPIGMTAPDVLATALSELGLPSKIMEGTMSSLKRFIHEGRPPIVLVRTGDYSWHYVVAIGYDKDNIILADPGWGTREVLTNECFHGSWSFTTDMDGEEIDESIVAGLLSLAEVSPFTLVVPDRKK